MDGAERCAETERGMATAAANVVKIRKIFIVKICYIDDVTQRYSKKMNFF